jgi:hypothetical protein
MRMFFVIAGLIVSPAVASAQLRFTQTSADLGELRGGLVYQHRFEFVNDSTAPIEITDVRLGCGCLQPVLEKRVYQPGEKGALPMYLRTLGQPNGARTWQAHVQYRGAGKTQEIPLLVAAKIRNEVTVEPSIVAMTIETTLKQELTITDHRATAFKVVNVAASTPAVHVKVQPMGNGVTKAIIEVSASELIALRQEAMLNIYTDDPYYRQLQVPLTLTRATRASISAAPDKVEINGAGSQLVRLRSSYDQAVRIDKADADHPAIKCTWAAGPGNDATLKITVAAVADPIQANVRVQVGGSVLTIPVAIRKE